MAVCGSQVHVDLMIRRYTRRLHHSQGSPGSQGSVEIEEVAEISKAQKKEDPSTMQSAPSGPASAPAEQLARRRLSGEPPRVALDLKPSTYGGKSPGPPGRRSTSPTALPTAKHWEEVLEQ